MKVAGFYDESISNGLGWRAVLFVSGCPHHCPGCHNKEAQNFNYGTEFNKQEIIDRIKEKGRIEVKGENVKISVKPEASSLVEIRMIDGRKCLVIPMDSDMEVNGIIKKITEKLKEEE